MKTLNYPQKTGTFRLGLLAATLLATRALAAVTGQWDFNAGNLNATTGNPLEYHDGSGGATELATQFGTTTSFGIPDIQGGVAQVIRVPKNTKLMGLVMRPNLPASGGGSLANQYSLAFDILCPTNSTGKARTLLQIDDPVANNNAGDISINTANGVGAAVFHGAIPANSWRRVVVTVDLVATPPVMTKYIDGVKVGAENLASGVDGRWAINDKDAHFGSDTALLFSDSAAASEIVFLNSLQVHDTVLTPNYVAAMGSAQAGGIPSVVTPQALVADRQPAPGATLVFPNLPVQARLLEGSTPINQGTIRLYFDGEVKTAQIISTNAGELLVTYNPGLLAPSSTHQVELKYVEPATAAEVSSGIWSFTLAPYNYPPIDLAKDSLLYMPFELPAAVQGQAVTDLSPQSNDGVLTVPSGTDLLTEGRIGKAIDFQNDGNVNHVALEKPWAAIPNTFAAWVKLSPEIPSGTRPGVIMGSYPNANNINWEVTTGGQARLYWNGGSPNWVVAGTDLRTGNWEHIAFVRDVAKGQIRFYWNGRLFSTFSTLGAEVNPAVASYIGADLRGTGTPKFRGGIDEVVLFNRPFTDEEVWRIYARAFQFPTYGFQVPQVVSVSPAEAATKVSRVPAVVIQIDETNSTAKVDRSVNSLSLTVNGVAQTLSLEDTNGLLVLRAQSTQTLAAGTTYTNRLSFQVTPSGSAPVEKIWTFTTAPLPTITTQPADRRVYQGGGASFTVGAQVSPPVTYEWRHNGTTIPNAGAVTFSIAAVAAQDAGTYSVVVRDIGGSVTSTPALLQVDPPLSSDPAESLRYDLSAHWAFDTNFSSLPAGYDGTPLNGASLSTEAKLGAGSLNLQQASSQWVRVDQRVIPDGALAYSVAGWFKVTGGSGRRFLWETAPNYAISTEITPAGTLKAFSLLADSSGPNADTLIVPPVDEWHHAAVTFDSLGGVASIYYDGQKVEVPFALGQGIGTSPTTAFHIGTYRSADTRFFDGFIDDVAVWTRVLNASEIAYLAAGNVVPAPLPPPQAPIAITVQPQDAIVPPDSTLFLSVTATGAVAFNYQWRLFDTNLPAATSATLVVGGLTNSGDYSVVITDGGRFATSRVAHVQVQALPVSPAASLPIGLRASWSFDSDFSASQPGFNGTGMGGASIVSGGRVGAGAVQLRQGSQQYVRVPVPVIPDGTMTYTVAGWIKVQGGSGRRFLWETATANYPISTEITPAGTLKAFTRQSNLNSPSQDTLIVVPQEEWHHVAVTYNSIAGKVRIYYDGVLFADGFDVNPNIGTAPTTGFNIGTFRSASDRFFEGLMDEVGVWGRALAEAEIQFLAAGNPIVSGGLRITSVTRNSEGVNISWENGTGPFKVQYATDLGGVSPTQWIDLVPQAANATSVTDTNAAANRRYYRVVGQ